MEKLITIGQIAEIFDAKARVLEAWAMRGLIKATKVATTGGKSLRFFNYKETIKAGALLEFQNGGLSLPKGREIISILLDNPQLLKPKNDPYLEMPIIFSFAKNSLSLHSYKGGPKGVFGHYFDYRPIEEKVKEYFEKLGG